MPSARTVSQGHAPSAPLSIEEVRRRARHRLIGAAVLVLFGVVGFSLLFDTQPRPLPVDIPIVIPSKSAPPTAPVASKAATPDKPVADKPVASTATVVAAADSLGPREEVVGTTAASPETKPAAKPAVQTETKPDAKAAPKPEAKPDSKPEAKAEPAKADAKPTPKPEPKPEVKSETKPAAKAADAERARALLDGKAEDKAAANERIVVQVGAFSDVARAREARLKLERAGLKTYTHVADTADGKRIRVRVGPFATKAEADKAAARVKALGLPAAILTL